MSRQKTYISLALISLVLLIIIKRNNDSSLDIDQESKFKIALREIGHHLLLANNDSTSIVKPVILLEENKYEISFENTLSFYPDSLITIVERTFKNTSIENDYILEVKNCNTNEVAYSFEMLHKKNDNLLPCRLRMMPLTCYTIELKFQSNEEKKFPFIYLVIGLIIIVIIVLEKFYFKKKAADTVSDYNNITNNHFINIGHFKFFEEENKLIRESFEISLSKKETEILSIFVSRPNQIVKRDELTKRIWEDNGVIVGRSLDTHISNLRKKLKEDETIKLVNVHGVGYRLEIK